MNVLMLKDVKGLGGRGQVVTVAEGYARNFLFPRGLAQEAKDGAVRAVAHEQKRQAEKKSREQQEAQALAASLHDREIVLELKVGETGRLFGSVTSKDVHEALERQLGIKVDKHKIEFDQPVKSLGRIPVALHLYPGVVGQVWLNVKERAR